MNIKTFVFNPFYENTYVISSNEGNCIIVDPGCYEDFERKELMDFIQMEGLKVDSILNTHCHIDHVLGNYFLKDKYKVQLKIPINEQEVYNAIPVIAPQWGITRYHHAEVEVFLKESELIQLDEISLDLIEVPGHSPGHLMFYNKQEKIIIGGDVLFRESIGRTDLPGGDHNTLLSNIQDKVYTLPEDVIVYPGHGPTTTIGYEKKNNPFVRG